MYHLVSAPYQERDKYKCSNGLGKMCPLNVLAPHLAGEVGVVVEQLRQVEHDRLAVQPGVGEDQLQGLAGRTRLWHLQDVPSLAMFEK